MDFFLSLFSAWREQRKQEMNFGGGEASRRADGSRRTRLSGTADHAREEEIAAQVRILCL